MSLRDLPVSASLALGVGVGVTTFSFLPVHSGSDLAPRACPASTSLTELSSQPEGTQNATDDKDMSCLVPVDVYEINEMPFHL